VHIPKPQIRKRHLHLAAAILIFVVLFAPRLRAQDDLTTQNASSALNGGWITGPASNPLSLLNGPVNRTYGSRQPYDFPDVHPATDLDTHLPKWLRFEATERLRFEGYENSGFKPAQSCLPGAGCAALPPEAPHWSA
jgi:hypothetical protein